MASILIDHSSANLTGYSVQEDATPLDPSNTTGGVGQIDYETEETEGPEGSVQLSGLDIQLSDYRRGATAGIVNDVKGENGIVAVSADGRLNSLVGTVSAAPMVDTLQAVVLYYLSLGGITEGIFIDESVAFTPVAVPGFNDDLWLRLKQLAAVHGCEIALVGNKVVVRPVRSFQSDIHNETSFSWGTTKGDAAQYVEVTYYGNEWVSEQVVYPYTDDERSNHQSWEVPAGTVVEDDINLAVSLASIQQPVCVDSVDQNYGLPSEYDDTGLVTNPLISAFTVYDANNLQVTPALWKAQGGDFVVSINEDTTSIHVKITAPQDGGANASPFRIVGRTPPTATTADDATDYPSFFLVGSGVYIDPQVLRVPTGVSPGTSVNEVGETVQVHAVASLDDAYRVAVQVAKGWVGTKQTVSGTLTGINRINDNGSYRYPPFGQFDAANQETFGVFDTAWTGKTFGDFNAAEKAQTADEFDNQTFGNVAGARLQYKDAYYRISTATITDENITFDAESDTTFRDFSLAFSSKTMADFDKRFTAKTFRQFDRIPLTTKDSTGTIYVPAGSDQPYPDTFYPDELYPDGGGTTGGTSSNQAAPDTIYPDTHYPN